MVKITQKIMGVAVVKNDPEPPKIEPTSPPRLLKRPDDLEGTTYKIKTPLSEHALYVTINDTVGPNGTIRPFEIFINSKNMENFTWIVALTRTMSAVFRHGGDVSFLVEELRSVFDPKGGYFKPGGKYMPSLVAEIGECLERHLIKIGMVKFEDVAPKKIKPLDGAKGSSCPKCGAMALFKSEGCEECHECGYSRCSG